MTTTELMPIKSIKGNPKNPRIIKDDKFQKLVKSLQDFPEMANVRPVVCNTDMVILGGNMRWKAAIEAGWKEIPVTVVDWSEERQQEFIIKDNVSGGEWNWDDLANEWDVDLLGEWGLDLPDITMGDELTAEEDDFEVPDQVETDIVEGDLFEIGEHRLLCGDSTSVDAVERLMDGQKAEMLFTSPPYSDMREYNGGKDLTIDNLIEFIPTFLPFANYQVINLGIQRKDSEIVQYWNEYIQKAKDCGYKFLSWNIWSKENMSCSIGNQTAMFPIWHEWIFVFGANTKQLNCTKENISAGSKSGTNRQKDGSLKKGVGITAEYGRIGTVIKMAGDSGKLHPAMFPIELPSEYIKAMTDKGNLIAEPFTGSGSTMVASHQLNRKCYGMELDPKYCQVTIDRMKKLDPDIVIKKNGVEI